MYENFDIGHDLKIAFEDGYRAGVEATQPKWIPVTERLPNDKEKVVTYKNGIISIQVYEKKEKCMDSRWLVLVNGNCHPLDAAAEYGGIR